MSNPGDWFAAPMLAVFAGAATLATAQFLSRVAVAANWLPDHPNHRSSHRRVTPRSGGIAIFIAWLAGVCVVAGFGSDAQLARSAARLTPLVGLVFLIGLVDDFLKLHAAWKFAGQTAIAIAYVMLFGPLQMAPLPFFGDAPLGPVAAIITVFWIVAFMNTFNFMDGVNGIAAACAAFALFAVAIAAEYFSSGLWAVTAGLTAVALVGFLPFNFPTGRLFMGDNGSQMVGFLIAATAIGAANASGGDLSVLFLPVAMAPFIVDVAFTLAHRMLRKRNILVAHREHIYQLALRLGLSHVSVTAIYLGLTAFSTATAIAMLRLTPEAQWLAPLFLTAAYGFAAGLVFAKARSAGLLIDKSAARKSEDPTLGKLIETPREPFAARVSPAAE